MNTKATAAAPNAPTAKDESKATNAGNSNFKAANSAKYIPMTSEEINEYNELKANFDNLSDEQEARLVALKKKAKAAKESKGSYVTQLKNEIGQSGLTISDLFGPNEAAQGYDFKHLFTPEELKAAIMQAGYGVTDLFNDEAIKAAAGVKTGKGTKAQNQGSAANTAADKGELWIKMPGVAPKYYKGQVYKKMSKKQMEKKDFSAAMGQSLPKNWLTNDTIEILMANHATPKAKELYEAKDPDFMAEMNDLVKAITTHKDYIAAKGAGKDSTEKQAA